MRRKFSVRDRPQAVSSGFTISAIAWYDLAQLGRADLAARIALARFEQDFGKQKLPTWSAGKGGWLAATWGYPWLAKEANSKSGCEGADLKTGRCQQFPRGSYLWCGGGWRRGARRIA